MRRPGEQDNRGCRGASGEPAGKSRASLRCGRRAASGPPGCLLRRHGACPRRDPEPGQDAAQPGAAADPARQLLGLAEAVLAGTARDCWSHWRRFAGATGRTAHPPGTRTGGGTPSRMPPGRRRRPPLLLPAGRRPGVHAACTWRPARHRRRGRRHGPWLPPVRRRWLSSTQSGHAHLNTPPAAAGFPSLGLRLQEAAAGRSSVSWLLIIKPLTVAVPGQRMAA